MVFVFWNNKVIRHRTDHKFIKMKESKLLKLLETIKFLEKESILEASETDSVTSFPQKTLSKLKSANLLTAGLPAESGGYDLGLLPGSNLALLQILKSIGKGNLILGRIIEGHINAQILINQFGSKKQKKIFARDAVEGKLFGVWNTQANDGTFISKIGKDIYQLDGSKTFATGTDFVMRPIVTAAKKDGGWQMCVVPLEKASVKSESTWWNPMGMKSSRSFKITFLKTEISKINLLGKSGEYYDQPWFSGGAVRFAAVQMGAVEQLMDETKKYLISLNRTHDPFQKMRIGQMSIAVKSGNQWINDAANRMDRFMKRPTKIEAEEIVIFANMMRTAIELICTEVIILCQKCVGARGLNKPYHFERIIRDLNTYLRQPAPDQVLADVGAYVLNSSSPASEIWNLNK